LLQSTHWLSCFLSILLSQLPANMSGAEKREKMVVWEAAISSSLTHPNIVQTYTYSIKPIQETDQPGVSCPEVEDIFGIAPQDCR